MKKFLLLLFFTAILAVLALLSGKKYDRRWESLTFPETVHQTGSAPFSEILAETEITTSDVSGIYAEAVFLADSARNVELVLVWDSAGVPVVLSRQAAHVVTSGSPHPKSSIYSDQVSGKAGQLTVKAIDTASGANVSIQLTALKLQKGDPHYLFDPIGKEWTFILVFAAFFVVLYFYIYQNTTPAFDKCLFIVAALVSLFYTINRHRQLDLFSWESELYADQGGYYVYGPAAFLYQFDAGEFPTDIDKNLGEGFKINKENNTIFTKYTYGVALLQSPFFLAAGALSSISGENNDGFTGFYRYVPDVAAWFYALLAMILLYRTALRYYDRRVIALSLFSFYTGQNIFYYSFWASGFSHAYSLALFALFIYLADRLPGMIKRRFIFSVLIFLTGSIIILVRPLNALFIPAALIIGFKNDWKALGAWLFQRKNLLVGVFIFILVWFPQFLYWKYLTGSWIYYSYEGEGFSYLLSPRLLGLWFSPHNGLFVYNPLYLLVFVSLLVYWFKERTASVIYLVTFFVLCYVCASWHSFNFGCAFGARNFIEYSALFLFPFVSFTAEVLLGRKWKKLLLLLVFSTCIFFNQKLMADFRGCYTGKHTWDYSVYTSYLQKQHFSVSYSLDENLNAQRNTSREFVLAQEKIGNYRPGRARIMVDYESETEVKDAQVILHIRQGDSTLVWAGNRLAGTSEGQKTKRAKVDTSFDLPGNLDQVIYQVFIFNPGKEDFLVKTLKITFD